MGRFIMKTEKDDSDHYVIWSTGVDDDDPMDAHY